MNAVCQFCGAKHWLAERIAGSTTFPTFSHCCHRGKVALDPLPDPPLPIRSLLTDQTSQARHFHCHIRQYNCSFAFTSFCTTENDEVLNSRSPWTWKTGYQLYHCAGTLLPPDGEQPVYAQLYFYDADDVIHYRTRRNPNLWGEIIDILHRSLSECNPFSQVFLHACDILHRINSGNLAIHIVADPLTDQRRYNIPTVDEIAVVIVGNDQDVNTG